MRTHTYFWINDKKRVVSPYFDSEEEAFDWLDKDSDNETNRN